MRPLAPYMAMITKLVDGDSYRALLHRGALSRIRRRVRRESAKAIRDLVRRIEIAIPTRTSDVCLKLIQCNPPSFSPGTSCPATMSFWAWTFGMLRSRTHSG